VNAIQVDAKFPRVASSDLAEFKQVAAEALEIARGEPGVLRYEWYFDETQTVCVVRETYQDSDALLAHISTLGETLQTLSELGGGCELEVFGDPSGDLLDVTGPVQRSVFRTRFQGK
jgi:quinol monooxygenase YgiN